MEITNYRAIKSIKLLHPELMSPDAENKIISLFNKMQELKDEISDRCMAIEELRKSLSKLEQQWNDIQDLVEVVFETKYKEEVKGDICIGFNFGTEVNKHIH